VGKSLKRPSDKIIDKYLDRISERKVNEIVVKLKEKELKDSGYRPSEAKTLTEAIWKKFDNNYDIRLDMRPDYMGGPQLHIRNRRKTEWAYRDDGTRNERSRFTAPSTRAVKDIVQKRCQILNCELRLESINIIHYSRFDTK